MLHLPRRRALPLLIGLAVAAMGGVFMLYRGDAAAPPPAGVGHQTSRQNPDKQATPEAAATPPTAPTFDKRQHSIDDPASPWIVANKRRPLNPADFTPDVAAPAMKLRLSAATPEMQVSRAALGDLERLNAAATAAGLPMMLASGYRSYATQVAVYNNEVRRYGQEQADRQSARPGHSEHQTGLAIDLAPANGACMIEECFGTLPEGRWLAAHAHKYGFIIRYAQVKEAVTGYLYEPWHLRYVGPQLAAELQRLGNPTLEEFFGLPAAPGYL